MSALSLTRVVAGATISPTTENANQAAIEAKFSAAIDSDNMAADSITKTELNSDVVRADYGLAQHTDGSLQVDVSDTNPCLEVTDGGLRAKVDDSTIERASGGLQIKDGGITAAKMATTLLNALYPVGIVVTFGVATNPNTLFGFGTWAQIKGRVIVGIADSGTFNTLDATGGAETHTLTEAEMPSHTHTINGDRHDTSEGDGDKIKIGANTGSAKSATSASAGSGDAHNNLQPYIVKYVWQRTA